MLFQGTWPLGERKVNSTRRNIQISHRKPQWFQSLFEVEWIPLRNWRKSSNFWYLRVINSKILGQYEIQKLPIKCFDPIMPVCTDYWLPMNLFSSKSQTFGLGQTNFGAFGIFSASAPISVHYCLYIHIPNIYLWFEFGPQRIRDLAIVCP